MSGTLGGVDASIPLRAGVGTGQAANQLTNNPLAFIDAMTRLKTLQLLPGQLQLQQQELQTGQQSIESNAVKLAQVKAAAAANYLRPLLGQANVSHDDVIRALGASHGVPGVNTDALIERLAAFQPGEGGNYRQFVVDNLLPSMSESGALQALTPTLRTVGAGGQILIGQELPLASGHGGQLVEQGRVRTTMTPAEKAAGQATMVPTERGPVEGTIPVGTRFDEYGNLRDANGNIVRSGAQSVNDLTGALPTGFLPTGNPAGTQQDIEAYKAAQNAMPEQQRNLVAGTTALQALQLARTGPGTANVNRMKSFLIAQGFPGAEALDPNATEAYQIARKNLLRFAQDTGSRIGTDLGLATKLESNANVDTLLNSANEHILKQDIGLARQRIAQTLTAPGAGGTGKTEFGTGMGAHVQNFTAKTDPVAFAWDLLSPAERKAHLDQIAKQEGGMAKWERSMQIARDTGMIKVPTQAQ